MKYHRLVNQTQQDSSETPPPLIIPQSTKHQRLIVDDEDDEQEEPQIQASRVSSPGRQTTKYQRLKDEDDDLNAFLESPVPLVVDDTPPPSEPSSNSFILAIHDPLLNSLSIFWYIFWLCTIELILFSLLVLTFILSLGQSSGPVDNESIPLLVLYLSPPTFLIMTSIVFCFSNKTNYTLRRIYFSNVCISIFFGLAGSIFAVFRYARTYASGDVCDSYYGWSAALLRTFFVILLLCPLPFRLGVAMALHEDAELYSHTAYISGDSIFANEPGIKMWRELVKKFDFTTRIPIPIPKIWSKSQEQTHHIHQHVIHLIFEAILLTVAITKQHYFQLIAVGPGLFAPIFGLTRLHALDGGFNMFALLAGVFLLGNDSIDIKCANGEPTGGLVAVLIFYCLVAPVIRLSSIFHTIIEFRMQVYHWALAQVSWVADQLEEQMETGTFENTEEFAPQLGNTFGHIKNFHTLLKYTDARGEATPLLSHAADSLTTQADPS